MGIFNEQSFDHPFARGIQGAPGVGFSLTADGNYDMIGKKLTNVGTPTNNNDAATKKYVDDNSSGSGSGGSTTTSRLTVNSNIDMKDRYRILNLKSPLDADEPATKQYADIRFLFRDGSYPMTGEINMNNYKIKNLPTPTNNADPATKKYVNDADAANKVDSSVFLKLDGTRKMTGNLDMQNNRIYNLPLPTGGYQPTTKIFSDLKYLSRDGTSSMGGNLNMNNKKIIHLIPPTSDTDVVTKKYVDASIPDTSSFLKKDGSVSMTSNLNLGNKKIVGLATPVLNTDAATKKCVDDHAGGRSPDLSGYLKKNGSVSMTEELNIGGNKIINIGNPLQNSDAVTKDYVDKLIQKTVVPPSHYKDEFSYLMLSASQWTDEIDGGTSFIIRKIGDLSPSEGNFHNYNHKAIFMTLKKPIINGSPLLIDDIFQEGISTKWELTFTG